MPVGTSDDEPKWHIVAVSVRWEKALAWHLHDAGIAYFLPMEDVTRVSHRKSERFHRPVFPGYVFFAGDEMAVDRAQRSPKFGRLIRVRDQDKLRIDLQRAQLAFGATLDQLPKVDLSEVFRAGRKCRVKMGHPGGLEGCVGYVDVVTNKGRVIIGITILGAERPTEIDPEWLEPE